MSDSETGLSSINAFMPIIGSAPPLAEACICILAVLEVSSESESGEQMRTPAWLGKRRYLSWWKFRKTRSSLLLSTLQNRRDRRY
jgi:hypothetical protein